MESPSEELKNLAEGTLQSSHESYQKISNDNDTMEERQAEACESEITDTDKALGHNAHYQQIDINSPNLGKEDQNNETNLEVGAFKSKEEMSKSNSNLDQELAENNDKITSEKYSEVVSENILSENTEVIIEPYHEYVSLPANSQNVQPRGAEPQPSEYTSEYMLEHQTENVYMPDQVQEQVNLNQSEQVYSTEIISDDSQDNAFEQQEDPNHTTVEEATPEGTETSDNNFVSEYEVEQHEENRNLSHLEQSVISESNDKCSLSENKERSIKIEFTNSSVENVAELAPNSENYVAVTQSQFGSSTENYDNISEIENPSAEDNVCSEPLGHDHFNVDVSTTENDVTGNKTSVEYDVKQEINSIATNINLLKDKQQEIESVSLSLEQEHISGTDTDTIENVEIANATADSISIEDYTISEVTEIQEGEYTIVEGPSSLEISANQHSEDSNSDGTLVLLHNYESLEDDNNIMTLTDEQHEIYLSELRSETESRQSTSSQSSESKPRRGRKPTQDIPMHVLGHNISKPVDSIPNGRALPKPRLGVKVPYRNLTSQIVTKAEIENEIMERARLKQEQANSRGDVLFARKLTQRLARKIAPSPNRPKKSTEASRSKESLIQNQSEKSENKVVEETEIANERNESATTTKDDSKIHNDSDLLAILEGEGEEMPVLPKETAQPEVEETNLKLLEREIALQQLQELPHQIPKQRIFRGRQVKSDSKAPTLTAEVSTLSNTKIRENIISSANDTSTSPALSDNSVSKENTNQPACAVSNKENSTTKQLISAEGPSISPKREQSSADSPKKQPIDIEPQVKVNMVLKTYSRKRKTVELSESLTESPAPKKTILSETEIKTEKSDPSVQPDVYVTKSSRVIKKKVIWDPDEIPSRSPKTTARPDMQSPKVTAVKSTKPTDKNSNVEKVTDKKSTERTVKEKLLEKKIVDKPTPKKIPIEKVALFVDKKIPLSRIESPKNKSPIKNKKSRSEVDKLLMDEGAVKMLYELKNTDIVRKKKDVYSVEKAHKEIIKKANEIKSDLEQNTSNESPKSLRKKEGNLTPSPIKQVQIASNTERKMSKDSIRSSLHTPPGSPAYSFSHSQSSMLVRRRSSSSISSGDEIDANDGSKPSRKKSNSMLSDIPKPKRSKKESKEEAQVEGSKKEVALKPGKHNSTENKIMQYKSFSVKKTNKHVTINLNYLDEKCYCTVQVLEELILVLRKISKDKDCNVVSITSSNKAFCLGLNYASLISEKEDVRKQSAAELAERVRDFLLCLLHFPKILVAGIQGDCVGFGVTMLPLFDMVIASDAATFSTTYASLGCIPEAGFLLSSPNLSNHGLAAELFYTTQKLTADDVFRRGLISRLCWPEKYNETLKNTLMLISKGSKQSLEATKRQLRKHIVQTTEAAINNETQLLIEHWISPECQKNFARINENSN